MPRLIGASAAEAGHGALMVANSASATALVPAAMTAPGAHRVVRRRVCRAWVAWLFMVSLPAVRKSRKRERTSGYSEEMISDQVGNETFAPYEETGRGTAPAYLLNSPCDRGTSLNFSPLYSDFPAQAPRETAAYAEHRFTESTEEALQRM